MQQVKDYIRNNKQLTNTQVEHLARLSKSAGLCSCYSLYSHDMPENDHTYIASGTCDHKCCFICNYNRQKATRRKYLAWFKVNRTVLRTAKGKVITQFQSGGRFKNETVTNELPYDLMHLTLTVPHYSETGFQGEQYYFSRISELFNWMRKEKEWLSQVYGGEYGIETTRKNNGLHIHIHSLLLVRQQYRNRNQLHKYILKKWNRLTIDPANPRKQFTAEHLTEIKKGNRDLTPEEIYELSPQGSTNIGLETIYSVQNGKKVRTTDFASPEMMKAVLETISYHFEPHAFDKENGSIDIPMLADLLPFVYKKVLYKKFGCLHGEKSLNISSTPTTTEMDEALAVIADHETGEIISERSFFIMNPAHAYHPDSENFKIHISKKGNDNKKHVEAETAAMAITKMGELIQYSHKTRTKS